MLKALVRHPRQPLSREKLAQLARGREFEPFDRSLDVQVSRLRKLVEVDPAAPRYIQTVWGVGYVFVPDGSGLSPRGRQRPQTPRSPVPLEEDSASAHGIEPARGPRPPAAQSAGSASACPCSGAPSSCCRCC